MQWFDILIVLILVGAVVWGLKTGLLEVAFAAVGAVAGWWLAGRYAEMTGELVDFSPTADAVVSVVAYVAIVAIAVFVAVSAGKVVRSFLSAATLGTAGLADRMGGMALGLVIGLALSGALIVALARLAFDFTPEGADIQAASAGYIVMDDSEVAAMLETPRRALIELMEGSRAVSGFLSAREALPNDMAALIPGDFAVGLDMLEEGMDGSGLAKRAEGR